MAREKEFVPVSVEEYLRKKHSTLINNYRTPDGKYSESCLLIAIDIAKLLIEAGRNPYIMIVQQNVRERGYITLKELVPRLYRGRVTWFTHLVCCCDGYVYDPILRIPLGIEINDYCKIVFGKDIDMKIKIPCHEMKDFIPNIGQPSKQ